MKNDKPRRERMFDETVCLQRDSLDLWIDDEIFTSAPISHKGMEYLKQHVNEIGFPATLFQIKIRNKVQWESRPTQIDFKLNTHCYETSVL
jgi:hypothetical protein